MSMLLLKDYICHAQKLLMLEAFRAWPSLAHVYHLLFSRRLLMMLM